jgi:hypothetical protein
MRLRGLRHARELRGLRHVRAVARIAPCDPSVFSLQFARIAPCAHDKGKQNGLFYIYSVPPLLSHSHAIMAQRAQLGGQRSIAQKRCAQVGGREKP